MAGQEELLYRPDIQKPVRELNETIEKAMEMVRTQDLPNSIITTYQARMAELNLQARELSARSSFLMDLILEDMDGYVGDAPMVLLQYIHDLTGIDFDDQGQALPSTDPVFTLPPETIKCIFRVANYYNDNTYDPEILDAVQRWDSGAFNTAVMNKAKRMGYLDSIVYGLKLLVMVVKVCYVVIVHYNVGYPCAMLSKILNFNLIYGVSLKGGKKPKLKLKKWNIGKFVAKAFGKIENALLKVLGFTCKTKNSDPKCTTEVWDKVKFRKITCCTRSPFFFNPSAAGQPIFSLSRCFEQWIKAETDPNAPERIICDENNRDNKDITPTNVEIAKATAIANYMVENESRTGIMARSDLYTVQSAKAAADAGVLMTESVQSSLNTLQTYSRTEQSGGLFNCFGYTPDKPSTANQKQNIMADKIEPGQTLIETGAYFQEYMGKIDEALTGILKYADKIVVGTSNLTKWGSSKQLCCYIYLLVVISSLFHSLITKGSICDDLDNENEDGMGTALRNELRWATNLQTNANVEKFVMLLQLLKQIIDIFIRKMKRSLFLQGMVLPLGEMFEMIKLTIMNGLSSFFDILFGPLDMILVNIKAIPEIRHMINNQCFGFDKLLDFLSCSLGNLKAGILLEIEQKIDNYKLHDIALIDDIYISRSRLEFLQALSRLIGIMINMIFQLRDCYDPRDMVSGIVQKQQEDMYNSVRDLTQLLGPNRIQMLDQSSQSLFGQNFLPDDATIAAMEADPSRLSAAFGELGLVGDTIVQNDLFCTNCEKKTFNISDFVDNDGNILPPAEFMKRAEDFSDMKIADVQNDMTEIFKVLRG